MEDAYKQPDTVFNKKAQAHTRSKITIIGGGSLHCIGFIQSIINHPDALSGCTIVLLDINKDNLRRVYALSRRALQTASVDVALETTTSQDDALEDADFVLTAFNTGGLEASALDEKLPLQYDLIGHSSIGAGGFFSALRTTPGLAGIAAVLEKVAPDAFLLNCATPNDIITEAISYTSGIRIIGLDDWPTLEMQRQVGLVEAAGGEIHSRRVGVNQANWATEIWQNGKSVLSQVIAWSKEYIANHQQLDKTNYAHILHARLVADYNAIPSRYMHYYYYSDTILGFQQEQGRTPAEERLRRVPRVLKRYDQEIQKDNFELLYTPDDLRMGNLALSVMHAIINDTGKELILSVPNRGAVNFIADDRIVELPCQVDARGATPLTQGDGGLQADQRALIEALAEYEGAAAQVALWGNRKDAIKALVANPLVLSYHKAEQIYDTLAQAHRLYLPARLLQ